jgi:hypothetical protein
LEEEQEPQCPTIAAKTNRRAETTSIPLIMTSLMEIDTHNNIYRNDFDVDFDVDVDDCVSSSSKKFIAQNNNGSFG